MAVSGCASGSRIPFAFRHPKVEAYSIEYALADAGEQLSTRASALRSVAWLGDSRDRMHSEAFPSASLKIEFPHPDQGAGAALATLTVYDEPDAVPELAEAAARKKWWTRLNVLSRRPSADDVAPAAPAEVVTMTIPRSQFELLMSDLRRENYFDERSASPKEFVDGAVSLSISHNHRTTHHSAVSEPRLDDFMRRVYHEGNFLWGDRGFARAIVSAPPSVSAPDPAIN